VAWQFYQPENGEGLVQAIRLAECPEDRFIIHLQGLEMDQVYAFENLENDERFEKTGTALAKDGFTVYLPRRSGGVWFYHPVRK
jgi:hypothetical protein